MITEDINTSTQTLEDISLKDILLKIRSYWLYLLSNVYPILLIAVFGGVIGVVYSIYKRPIYTSVTTFVLEEEHGGGGLNSLAGVASIAGIDIGGGAGGIFQGDNILQLYRSRNIIKKTLLTKVSEDGKSALLIDHFISFNDLRESWKDRPSLANIKFSAIDSSDTLTFTRLQDSVITLIANDINKNYLKVDKIDKKLSIISAEVKASDEFFAKSFNEQIVKNVSDFYIQTKTRKSLNNINILQQKVDSVRSIMNGAIYSASKISDATPNLNITRQVQRVAPIQRSQFSAETNKMILGELVKNLELSKIALRKETPLIQVVDEPVFPLERNRLSKPKAIVIGLIMFGFLAIAFFLVRKLIIDILAS